MSFEIKQIGNDQNVNIMEVDNKNAPIENKQIEEEVMGLDEDYNNTYITLVSADGCRGEVLRKYAVPLSTLISGASEEDKNEDTYKLELVPNGETLKDIINYMNIRKGEPYNYNKIIKPLVKTLMKDILVDPKTGAIDQNEVNFINEITPNRTRLYNLTNSANYMGMQDLLEICCCRIAALTRYKKAEDLQRVFDPAGNHQDDDYVDPIEKKYSQ